MSRPKHNRELKVDRNISPDSYMALIDLFHDKEWDIQSENYGIFERYVRTMGSLESEQQKDLFLDLSKRFIHIPLCKYMDYIPDLVSEIIKDYPGKKLCFTCCLPKKNIGQVKSATTVLYQIKGSSLKSRVDLSNVEYFCHDSVNDYVKYKIADNKHLLILVDDFIGSGDTALGAIDYVKEVIPKMSDDNIIVLSIAALQKGINELSTQNIKVYTKIILNRGISDHYVGNEAKQALDTMRQIEEVTLNVLPDFSLGYKQSEGLISMERCPNNTFPIYWKRKNDAPYER